VSGARATVSGHLAIDRYLAEGYAAVPGMSSRFAAGICGHLVRRQTELGISGSIVEIGTFEGRFFIALALGLAPGEHAFGFDTFVWPDDGVLARFRSHCERHRLEPERFTALQRDSRTVGPGREFAALVGDAHVRFIHIDGDHGPDSLSHDLALAHGALHAQGVICLDDMLHPEFPLLMVAVHDYLRAHPDMRLFCVIDREDIVAAAKFLICRADAVALYADDLMETFRDVLYIMGGDALGHHCVVLTPAPRLAAIR
jgi:hypothetical protein